MEAIEDGWQGSRAADPPAVELEGIARRFGRAWPLRGVFLRVGASEIVALTGRNGSGKTTLLRIVATSLRATRGTGRVFGHDLTTERDAVRGLIGLLGHSAGLYGDLTAAENLRFAQRMLRGTEGASGVRTALEAVGLAGAADARVGTFSAGMQRRLALARLMLRRPRVLLLDEPLASLDEDGARRVLRYLEDARRGGAAAIVATHSPERLAPCVDRVVRLEGGVAEAVGAADRAKPAASRPSAERPVSRAGSES